MPNAGLSRECEDLSQHKLLATKGFFSALPRFLLFPGNRGAQCHTSISNCCHNILLICVYRYGL